MSQPSGFTATEEDSHFICRLKKSLYGLKKALRMWYQKFDSYIRHLGYNRSNSDTCMYLQQLVDESRIYLILYVDDMLIARSKAYVTNLVIEGPLRPEPVASVNEQVNNVPVASIAPDTTKGQEQELATLEEEIEAQEAMRARERELKKAMEEEQRKAAENLRKVEDNLWKIHQANDWLKEEKEKLLQEKEKLRRSAEVEIERLKEEL